MPFAGKFSCFRFTYASVRQNAPRSCGVYAISNAAEWLFVGSADDLQAVLHKHLLEIGTPLKAKAPTGFTFETCHPEACRSRLQELLAELRPACNAAPVRPRRQAFHHTSR